MVLKIKSAYTFLLFVLWVTTSSAQINHALVVVPQTGNFPSFKDNCYLMALDKLSISYTTYLEVSDFLVFRNDLPGYDPDSTLVIIDSWFLTPFDWGGQGGVSDFINQGGRVIFSAHNLDVQPIRSILGVAVVTRDPSFLHEIYAWNGSGILDNLTEPFNFDATPFMPTSTSSNRLTASEVTGVEALAGFVPVDNTSGQAAIISANQGKTLALGFCLNLATDADDCIGMAENMINYVTVQPLPQSIPTLSAWALMVLFLTMSIIGVLLLREGVKSTRIV